MMSHSSASPSAPTEPLTSAPSRARRAMSE
jgi:hypothetical protein